MPFIQILTIFISVIFLVACGESSDIKTAKAGIEQNLLDPSSVQFRNAKIISGNEAERISVQINPNHQCNKSRSLDEIYRCKIRNPEYIAASNAVDEISIEFKKLLSKKSIKIVCLEYNAKNAMGGYAGFEQEICRVEDDRADCLGLFLSSLGKKLGDSKIFMLKDADMACK